MSRAPGPGASPRVWGGELGAHRAGLRPLVTLGCEGERFWHRAHPTRVPAPCGEPAPGCRCSAALAASLPGFAGVRVCQLLCQPLCLSCWWRIVQNFHGLCVLFVACCLRFLMPRLTVSDAVSASAQEEVMLPCSGEGDLPKCHSICLPGVLSLLSETSML